MNHAKVTGPIGHGDHLKGDAMLVITKEHQTIFSRCARWRRLLERQASMLNDEPDPVVADPVLPC